VRRASRVKPSRKPKPVESLTPAKDAKSRDQAAGVEPATSARPSQVSPAVIEDGHEP
jgi:hypothetical protein